MCSIDKYIIVLSFPLRPSSHGTEQNMGDPRREETADKSYFTIPTLFTVQQSFSSVRHGKEVYRLDDMIWLIDLICTVPVLLLQGSTCYGTKFTCQKYSRTLKRSRIRRGSESRFGIDCITVSLILMIDRFNAIRPDKLLFLRWLCIQLVLSAPIPRFQRSGTRGTNIKE